jgi:hypothetical protein
MLSLGNPMRSIAIAKRTCRSVFVVALVTRCPQDVLDPSPSSYNFRNNEGRLAVFDRVIRGWTAFESAGTSLNIHGGSAASVIAISWRTTARARRRI